MVAAAVPFGDVCVGVCVNVPLHACVPARPRALAPHLTKTCLLVDLCLVDAASFPQPARPRRATAQRVRASIEPPKSPPPAPEAKPAAPKKDDLQEALNAATAAGVSAGRAQGPS